MSKGIWYAIGAYVLWGLLPVYWKWLHGVPAPQVLSHRIVWSALTLVAVIVATRRWAEFRALVTSRRVLLVYAVAGLLLGANWLTYVWAVHAGFIVETSLGYFINPLLSVLLGVIFLGERLRRLQWVPIALAAAGVVYLTFVYGALPWIALTLACTFGVYGLVKKTAPLGSLYGLALETAILFVPALAFLAYSETTSQGVFLHAAPPSDLLLAGAGIATTIPLLLFASAAQRIPLTLVGILQYIAPTLQFLLGVLVYREPFSLAQAAGFGIVWLALVLFAAESYLNNRAQAVTLEAE